MCRTTAAKTRRAARAAPARSPIYKKAIVTLKAGDKIELV
jgi:ribosomal protein L23